VARPAAEDDQRRARRDLAVALFLSLSIHVLFAAFTGPQRLIGTSPNEAREVEDVSLKPTSISVEKFTHTAASAAKPSGSAATKQVRALDQVRTERHPAAAAAPVRAAHALGPVNGKITARTSPSGTAGKVHRAGTSPYAGPSPALTAPSNGEAAASDATARLQRVLDGIAASAAPPTPLRATPDAAAIALVARSGYDELINPPAEVVARAVAIISFKRTAGSPDSVFYVLRHRRVLGISFCTGWSIVAHPLGGGAPQTGYSTGPCRGDSAALPAWADRLPPLPSHDAPAVGPSPTPRN
jgi:hypothetical protein